MVFMNFVVKNTTKCGLLDLFCPHTCRGCGRLGAILCDCCKNDIIRAHEPICPLCKQVVENGVNICQNCDLPFEGLWVVGWRQGALAKMIKAYKYQSTRAAGESLAELVDKVLPKELPMADAGLAEVVVVPLPTIGKHVRARGIDHTKSLAKKLARRRGWKMERVLGRETDTVQVGTKAAERQKQAKRAYVALRKVDQEKVYLLLDDVWTTGATMLAAAEVLRRAGAEHVYGMVLATGKGREEENLAGECSSDLKRPLS